MYYYKKIEKSKEREVSLPNEFTTSEVDRGDVGGKSEVLRIHSHCETEEL